MFSSVSETRWPTSVGEHRLPRPATVGELFQQELQDVQQQAFLCAMLNEEDELIGITEVFTELDSNAAPAALVAVAKHWGASQMFVAFHLPDGGHWAEATVETVAKIRRSLAEVDVRLVDLFLTGGRTPTSMALRGWI